MTKYTIVAMALCVAISASSALADRSRTTETKLKGIVIPELNITDTAVEDFFGFLSETIPEIDTTTSGEKKSANFFLNLTDKEKAQHLSYSARQKSIYGIVKDVCRAYGFAYHVEDNVVWITSPEKENRILRSKTYTLGTINAKGIIKDGAEKYFADRGVEFPEGAGCKYVRRIQKLFATNTPANLKRLEAVLAKGDRGIYEAHKMKGPGLRGGVWDGQDINRMRGGAFDGQDVHRLRGGRVNKEIGNALPSKKTAERTRYMKDMDTYKEVMRLRAEARRKSYLHKKLEKIVIPELELERTTFQDAVALLEDISQEYDTSTQGTKGFHAVMRTPRNKSSALITFRAKKISVMQALRTIVSVVGVSLRVEGNHVVFYTTPPEPAG